MRKNPANHSISGSKAASIMAKLSQGENPSSLQEGDGMDQGPEPMPEPSPSPSPLPVLGRGENIGKHNNLRGYGR